MGILDNSPSKNRIRWCDMQVVYKDNIYNIEDGFTDKMYVYWDLKSPNVFLSSDSLPYEYIEIVFINNNGIHTIYPNLQIQVLDERNLKLKVEHLNDSIKSLREYTTLLNKRLSSIEKQVISIREYMNVMDKRIKKLEKDGTKIV